MCISILNVYFFNFQITSSISNWSILCGMHKNLVKSPKYGKSWMDEIIGRLSSSLNWEGSVHGGGGIIQRPGLNRYEIPWVKFRIGAV